MRRIIIFVLLLAILGVASGCKCKSDCKCGCVKAAGWCGPCLPCDIVKGLEKVEEAVQQIGDVWDEASSKVGEVFDEAKAAVSDPSGYIRENIINKAQDLIGDALAEALDVQNVCNNAEKDAFGTGGWHAYYGKRLWETRAYATIAASFFPVTTGAAANEMLGELRAQSAHMMALLEQAAQDAGDDLVAALTRLFDTVKDGALSGNFKAPEYDSSTFGLKGKILRVSCSNKAAGFKLPSEGYYQLAFAYRIKDPMMRTGTPPLRGVPVAAQIGSPANDQPKEVCKHDCDHCGQHGPCAFGVCSGGCKRCCFVP